MSDSDSKESFLVSDYDLYGSIDEEANNYAMRSFDGVTKNNSLRSSFDGDTDILTQSSSSGRNSLLFKSNGVSRLKSCQSVCTLNQLMEYISLTIVAIVLMLIIGIGKEGFQSPTLCEDGNKSSICDLQVSMKRGAIQYQVLAAFILGGFVLSSVDMWRQRRHAYVLLCNTTRNLIMNIGALVHSNDAARHTMIRWVVLAFELSVLKARGSLETKCANDYLTALHLLESDERATFIHHNENSTVYWWILAKAEILTKEEHITGESLKILSREITRCREAGNDLMSRYDKDQPRPYCVICAALVNLNLLLTSLSKGLEWGVLFRDSKGSILSEPNIYVEIFILFTYNMIFAMLFDLCSALYNPFGARPIDLPHSRISGDIRRFACEVGANKVPSTMHNEKVSQQKMSLRVEEKDAMRLAKLENEISSRININRRTSMLMRPGLPILE